LQIPIGEASRESPMNFALEDENFREKEGAKNLAISSDSSALFRWS
jgi:hypothetical protein